MLDPDVRRQLREVAEAATEVFPNVDRVFAGIFDPPTVLSLLDALDEAEQVTAFDKRYVGLRMERDRLAEALAVAREALEAVARGRLVREFMADRAADALARIDTLTAPQGEPT